MSNEARLEQLQAMHIEKMERQRKLFIEMRTLLVKEGGLNESSRMVLKNLDAAIVASRRPGYFKIYMPTQEVKDIENKHLLVALTREVHKVEKEVKDIETEIDTVRHAILKEINNRPGPSIVSMDQWFNQFGKPKPAPEGMRSVVEANSKIYGGTAHHRGFKSLATSLTRGRCTL